MTRSDRLDVCGLVFGTAIVRQMATTPTELAIAGIVSLLTVSIFVFAHRDRDQREGVSRG